MAKSTMHPQPPDARSQMPRNLNEVLQTLREQRTAKWKAKAAARANAVTNISPKQQGRSGR
jgi:hypothetical protein